MVYMGLEMATGQKHFTLAAGESWRTEGDTEGVYCVSGSYAGNPEDCPVERDDTDSGELIELRCN